MLSNTVSHLLVCLPLGGVGRDKLPNCLRSQLDCSSNKLRLGIMGVPRWGREGLMATNSFKFALRQRELYILENWGKGRVDGHSKSCDVVIADW